MRFSLFVLFFLIEFLISRSWLYLRSMCSVHCLREPKGASLFPLFGSRKHISNVKLFSSKIAKMSGVVRFYTGMLISFDYPFDCPLNFLKSSLCIMLHVLFFLLDVSWEVKHCSDVIFPIKLSQVPARYSLYFIFVFL